MTQAVPDLLVLNRLGRQRARSLSQVDEPERGARFDYVVEVLLALAIGFCPLAFGAVEAWSEEVFLLLAALATTCWAAKLAFHPEVHVRRSWTFLPVALFIGLVAFQLVRLPAGLVYSIAPQTAALKARLLGDLPGAQGALNHLTLSFYPLATRHDLRLLLAISALFVVIVNVYQRPRQVVRLLATVAVVGAVECGIALAQDLSGTDKILWTFRGFLPKAVAGTFIHYSHFSQFANLTIGVSLGLIIMMFGGRHSHASRGRLSETDRRSVVALMIVIAIAVTTICLSMSRGGMIGLLVAFGVTVAILSRQRRLKRQAWGLAIAAALGCAALFLSAEFESVAGRFSTIAKFQSSINARDEIVRDIVAMWKKFPVFGTGLGTHEFVFPMFNHSSEANLASRAENEYAQVLEETGAVGLALVLLFVGLIVADLVRCVRDPRPPVRAAAVGLGFGIVAILVHSFSDFGQHLPPVALLTTVSFALLISLSRIRPSELGGGAPVFARPSRRIGRVIGVCCVIAASVWTILGANTASRAETAWNDAVIAAARLERNGWQGTNADYSELLIPATAASVAAPDDVTYRYWVNVYRWYSISREHDKVNGRVLLPPRGLEFAKRIVTDLQKARWSCPTFGSTVSLAGQLEAFVLSEPVVGAAHVRMGFELAPQSLQTCYAAGLLAAKGGAEDEAKRCFDAYLRLGGDFRQVADVYIRQVRTVPPAIALAADDPDRLLVVSDLMNAASAGDAGWRVMAKALRDKATPLRRAQLEREAQGSDPRPESLAALAALCAEEKKFEAATDLYRRAIDARYDEVDWHLALGIVLLDSGQFSDAAHEAGICLSLRPTMAAAQQLFKDASVPARKLEAPGTVK